MWCVQASIRVIFACPNDNITPRLTVEFFRCCPPLISSQVPDFDFKAKWLMIQSAMPLVLSLLFLIYAMKYLYKRLVLRRMTKLHTHAATLISAGLTVMVRRELLPTWVSDSSPLLIKRSTFKHHC